jgi:glycosyltransferase involved in cell wall biosynthesis
MKENNSAHINKPLISVCIPSYNNERFIKSTIQSVIDQTYDNWELIIADDVSSDTSLEIIKSFNDKRITILENKTNLGLAGNWNKVVSEAKGEYLKLLCGDDLLSPDCLSKQVAIFTSNKYPSVSLVTSYRTIIDEDNKQLMTRKFSFMKGLIASQKAISLNFLFGTNIIGEPAMGLFKTSVFSKIGNYDDSNTYLVDLDFWLRVLLTGDLYLIPQSLSSFRISRGSMTSQLKKNQAKLFRQFAKKIFNDKRFNINILQYYFSCVLASVMQILRRSYLYFYLR